MAEIPRVSMEMIAQESSWVISQSNIKDCDSNSFQLLIKAHDRIRNLQAENEQLQAEIANGTEKDKKIIYLERQIDRLNSTIKERDLNIENLQIINEKAIMDFILIEKQLNRFKADHHCRKNVMPIPSELNSPLSFSKINKDLEVGEPQEPTKINIQRARDFVNQQQKLTLDRGQNKFRNELFTFDKENIQRVYKSPQNGNKVLKNCFSELIEVNQLITKIQNREGEKYHDSKQKLKHYHNYCSSIEKKYSPNTAIKKQANLKKSPTLILKSPIQSPSCKNQQFPMNFNQKPWLQTSTSNGTSKSFGLANERVLYKLNFY